jgi:Protein of unknown function (DUF3570)
MTLRRPLLLTTLACTAPRPAARAAIPQQYDYGYQLYEEDDDRIRIESHYLRGKLSLDDETEFRFQWLSDAISGSSPTGQYDDGSGFYAELDDLRIGVMGAISRKFGDHRVELEVSRSSEEDYLSWGYALKDEWELNEQNTTLTFGLNYLDDTVKVPVLGYREKQSVDFFVGLNQLLDRNTFVSANFTLGYADGYLNDPYKVVQRTDIVQIPDGLGGFIPFPVRNLYLENRPDSRLRQVLQLEGRHFFEKANGALDAIYRYSHDDFGINSHTFQVEWRQGLGQHVYVTPFFRYYRQNEADFFVQTLDGVPIEEPYENPTGAGPHYSADYRLSAFDATSYGVKLNWQINETFSFNAAYERYDMEGRGEATAPDAAYPDADMWTFGVSAKF